MFDTNLHAPWYSNDNMPFSVYAKHTQEVEDIIEMIGNDQLGQIECDDDMSESDMRYIENEVEKRYGFSINIG